VNDWSRWVPGVRQVRSYERPWLRNDITAGLVLVGLLTPAGMAYAQASGLPPVTGLYATIVPLLVYAVFGPSRILVMGPDSALAPLVAAAVIPLSNGDPARAIAVAAALSLMVGAIGLLAGLARFGFLADLLSLPVRYGYLNGIALTIVISQLPKVLGIDAGGETPIAVLRDLFDHLDDGIEFWPLAIASMSLVIIVTLRRWFKAIPGALAAIIIGILLAVAFGLDDRGIDLVGELPRGLPTPAIPDVAWGDLGTVFAAAIGIAFVAFADTSVLARVYALRQGARVDANQELVALGAVNIGAGLFQGFPVSGSQSRTPVAEDAGARTQLTGVVAAIALLALITLLPGLFRNLPEAALAGVVIAAALRVFTIRPMLQLRHRRRSEFVLAIATFAAVVFAGPVVGVGIAIALSLLNFVRRAWKPHTAELVRVDGLKGYHDVGRHPEGRSVPGLLLYRFDAPLFFANAQYFADEIVASVDRRSTPVRRVVVAAEPITDIDSTAAEVIDDLLDRLKGREVELHFAELKGHVRERLVAYELLDRIGADRFPRTVGEAVKRYVAETGTPWEDWEDLADGTAQAQPPA
jgi:high affinity sulfate transporter 1